mmetsp:Transcript_22245/g.39431  ORF Transcript_22245/g.39431 Transcript_22245/m.39431 type:complete len:387 (+) Transcript_22245:107-1267(+)
MTDLYVTIPSTPEEPSGSAKSTSTARKAFGLVLSLALLAIGWFALEDPRNALRDGLPSHSTSSSWSSPAVPLPQRLGKDLSPVIGVLSVPVEADSSCGSRRRRLQDGSEIAPTSCFQAAYVKWIEAAGGRVVPIQYNLERTAMTQLLDSVNGVLITGGDVPLRELDSQYMQAARYFYDYIVAAKKNGEHVPLWGTCMGLQLLSVLIGGPSVLEFGVFRGVDPSMLPLNFSDSARSSMMFNEDEIPSTLWQWFQEKNVTLNLHHDGVDPSVFQSNANLSTTFKILSSNVDSNGRPFVSTLEGKDGLPVFAVQWHPERPQFEYDLRASDPISHSRETIACSSWTAQFFINQSRLNVRRFKTTQDERNALISAYSPPKPWNSTTQNYYF